MENEVSPARAFFRNKWVRLVLVLDALALIAAVAILVINGMKTAVLYLDVTPIDAQILVNGKEYTNGSYKLMPGEYEITIARDGMTSKTFEVNLEGDSVVNMVTFLVGEDGGFGFYELNGNYDSFYKLASMASVGDNITVDQDTSAEKFVARYQADYDLYTSEALPINYTKYKITDKGQELEKDVTIMMNRDKSCVKTLCLQALMVGTDSQELIKNLLEDKGFKVEDYEITYKVY